MTHRRLLAAVAAAAAVPLVATGCSTSSTASSSSAGSARAAATTVKIEVTDDGCTPSPATIAAGALSFSVANKGADRVTEAEVLQDGRILGEKENLTPGLSGDFSLRLEPGQYVVYCPNAKTDRATLTVTPSAGSTSAANSTAGSDTGMDASLTAAVAAYRRFLQDQVDQLVPATKAFVAAVKAGDIARAKALYAPARSHYESIEPVAESFGDLDPQIDARVNDVASPSQWTGFHRIEKALWADKSSTGMSRYANKLMADVTTLQQLIPTAKLQPAAIANGAVELLGEVANSKITGEEDRYSHTDLWDFEANVAGVREAIDVLSPALRQRDPALLARAESQFTTVLTTLSTYKTADGYVNYSTVTAPERRTMTTQVNALAETLSKVAPAIV
jgi:iron uptake system component EfeO